MGLKKDQKKPRSYAKVAQDIPEPRKVKKPRYNAVRQWFDYIAKVYEAYQMEIGAIDNKKAEFEALVEELKKTSDNHSFFNGKYEFDKGLFTLELEFDETRQHIYENLKFNSYQVPNKIDFFKKV